MKRHKTDMDKYFDKCCKNKFVIESERLRNIAEDKKATKEDKDKYEYAKKLAIKACFDIIDKVCLGKTKSELVEKCNCGKKCDNKCKSKCKCKSKEGNKNKEKKHGKKK